MNNQKYDDLFADKYRISSSRLKNWNYSSPGDYFITICTYKHNKFFGKIVDGKMQLSARGMIANKCLLEIPKHFSNAKIICYVVMPNHVHLLIQTTKLLSKFVETHHDASLHKKYNNYYFHRIANRSSQTIPLAIKQFKSAVTKQCNRSHFFFSWQPRFFDHLIIDDTELDKIKYYIIHNPKNWEKDKLFIT